MADKDFQATMDLSGSINANPRRISLPRAAKRVRTNSDCIPATSQSMPPSTPPQTTDTASSAAESSPPSPVPEFEQSLNVNDQSTKVVANTPSAPAPTKGTKARGKKRNAEEDDEFSPKHDNREDLNIMDATEKSTKKSKSAPKRKTAVRKSIGVSYHVNNQLDKPQPHGQPEVWADKRQPLCETLPYYNAYQSGAYTSSGIVMGHLVDMEVDRRDKFDEQIVITSVGGGKSKDETGKSVRAKDHVKNHAAASFMRTKALKLPVAVIAGQGNSKCPSQLPHKYNVLDWFHITDVWPERCAGMIAWRVRLEKICLTGKSWWAAKGSLALTQESVDYDQKITSEMCSQCARTSKTIYNAGWSCLNTECPAFFQFENEYDDAGLEYTEEFVKERTRYQGMAPGPLTQRLLTDQDMAEMDAFGIEKAFKRGIVCAKCGCCSRRIAWDHWSCENLNCDFIHRIQQIPMPIDEVIARCMDPDGTPSDSKSKEYEFARGGIRISQNIYGPWDVNEYMIPGEYGEIIGFVRHYKSNGIINQQKDGPNEIFLQMQTGEFNLRRNPARLPGSTAEILTSHWAANWGAPYKFGVRQISKGFDEAPVPVLKAIKRLTWAGQVTVTDEFEPFQPFNECLSIGYFEDSKIGYHDDGEKELGPTVASLSLGASALMTFRPKAKAKIAAVPGISKSKAPGVKPAVLQILLEHGDIMVMHGRKIQHFYEHAVTPMGALRFALTCRYIRPELMADEAETQDAILKGTLPPGSEKYDYDGDMNAVPVVHSVNEVDKLVKSVTAKLKTGDLTASQVREINERLAIALNPPNTELERTVKDTQDLAVSDAS